MKKALIFLLCLHATGVISQTLEVNISNITVSKGKIIIELYNNKRDFLRKPEKRAVLAASDNGVKAIFKDLSEGDYAVGVMHDVNSNNKLDSNFLGIPKEPVAVSNNLPPRFGKPKFKHAKFKIQGNKKVVQNIVFNANIR